MIKGLRVAFCATAALVSVPVTGQTTAPADQAKPDGEIVVTGERAVTATKTDTPLIETPQAISVIPAQLIQDRSVFNLQETLRYSAGVAAESLQLVLEQYVPISQKIPKNACVEENVHTAKLTK